MPNILKYFMKPEAQKYEFPQSRDRDTTLEDLIRAREAIPEAPADFDPNGAQFVADTASVEADAPKSRSKEDGPHPVNFAREQAEAILREAEIQASMEQEKIRREAEQEAEEIRAAAREEGYRQGYADGMERAEADGKRKIEERVMQFQQQMEQFLAEGAAARDKVIEETRGELLDLAVAVAEKVVRVSLKTSSNVISRMILAATEKLKRREWVRIYIAGCDAKGMVQTDPVLASALTGLSEQVKIVPMAKEESGTCIIEMPDTIIDASASTQLENIRQLIRDSEP